MAEEITTTQGESGFIGNKGGGGPTTRDPRRTEWPGDL